jgi:hypothetical protein
MHQVADKYRVLTRGGLLADARPYGSTEKDGVLLWGCTSKQVFTMLSLKFNTTRKLFICMRYVAEILDIQVVECVHGSSSNLLPSSVDHNVPYAMHSILRYVYAHQLDNASRASCSTA